ncbi:Aste57867_22744 [Aphanomyces stellatus]|uniref:Aste57867_22744 protein n=1 Tax=Aphanomyces stellatus TaxID=120398 RepID=A0A485LKZ7_9STRA|nr:hypothetical protein As57867_022674 [Aphanomyces stellatus]VFT99397.1 Aste57867_22744 [Aphanomyces stellatus]
MVLDAIKARPLVTVCETPQHTTFPDNVDNSTPMVGWAPHSPRTVNVPVANEASSRRLLDAIRDGDEDLGCRLVHDSSIDINAEGNIPAVDLPSDERQWGPQQWTPLLYAASLNRSKIITSLLACPHIDIYRYRGRDAIFRAARFDHAEAYMALSSHPEIQHWYPDFNHELLHFTLDGKKNCVRVLAQHPITDVNFIDTELEELFIGSALHVACNKGDADIVRLLLACDRVDVAKQTRYGMTGLQFACLHGFEDVVRVLLELSPPEKLLPTDHDKQALHVAAIQGHVGVLQLLLATGWFDVNATNWQGLTPLHCAITNNRLDVVLALLESNEIDVNRFQEKTKQTALHMASIQGHANIVQALLGCKAIDVAFPDREGKTALDSAINGTNCEVLAAFEAAEVVKSQ